MLHRYLIAGLIAFLTVFGAGARAAYAQLETTTVRIEKPDAVVRARPSVKSDVVAPAPVGTVLALLDREDDWLWVLLPPDVNGTRRPGFVRTSDLQVPTADEASPRPDKAGSGKKDTDEGRRAKPQQADEARRLKQEQAEEGRRLKQAQTEELRRAKQQAEEERRLKQQQGAEEKRLQQQQAEADRRQKQLQVEEDRRLEKVKRDLDKAKQDFEKVAAKPPEPTEPPKER